MKISKIVSMFAVLALANVANADQDGFKISGDLGTSIFSNTGNKSSNGGFATGGAYGNGNNDSSFSLDLAEINVEKAMGNSSVVLGIGYGRIFDTINYTVDSTVTGAPKSSLNLTNAYFAHKFGDTGLSFKVGKYRSFMGYETYNYMDNMNYTRGYAFYYTMPFYLTGASANYVVNDMIDVSGYIANSTANTDLDDNRSKALGAQVQIKPIEGLKIKLNYLAANEGGLNATNGGNTAGGTPETKTNTYNAIATYTWTSFDFAAQYVGKNIKPNAGGKTLNMDVVGLYANYKQEVWGAGVRYEMANYDAGTKMDVGNVMQTAGISSNKINAVTATAWYDLDTNARVKVEVASNSSDKKVFTDKDGVAKDSTMIYGLGFMYRF